jgi:WD40 repeat protein/serine/threonine protein kinase
MQEQSIFIEALEMEDAAERAAFLDRACAGDAALRQRMERLLRHHQQADSFLESPTAASAATFDVSLGEGPGTVIGSYKLLQQIGEGGMGVVWMAEQEQPVRRKVALKIIKPGMDSRQVIARFEAERQALALMNHHNIARVLDAGTTDSGRPFFVMELIHGVPITKFCDHNQLTPRERLELFVPICQAIQHAHQKGIIHRDIKPSNVLVTLYDGKPVPKIIDFGVAKAIEQQLTERTLFTQYGTIIGTFEYMSPEQAEMSALGVDTRSDIYSLGVLLYELLTGSTPLERQRLRDASYPEIVRWICEEEPPRPSTRLGNSETLPAVAAARKMEPAKLTKLFRGELDWIVMKALEKDRNRRYESASSLAADVQRYLHDEPVLACPPTVGYRLGKFVRRNKRALATAALLVVMVLVAGGAVVASALWAATQAEARAQVEADAKKELEFNLYLRNVSLAQAEASVSNWGAVEDLLKDCPEQLRDWEWNYLKRLPDAPWRDVTAEVTPGVSANLGLAFHPSGEILAGPGPGNTVTVWDLTTGMKNYLPGHTDQVRCVAFRPPNGNLLATSAKDGLIRFWDPATGKPVRDRDIAKAHGGQWVDGLTFSPDGRLLASIGTDEKVRLWDVDTGKQRYEFPTVYPKRSEGSLRRTAFSLDGRLLACGGAGNTVKVWDVATGREKMSLPGHENVVKGVFFSPQGDRLFSWAWGSEAKVWDLAAGGRELFTLRYAGWAWSADFSPDGNLLAAGGNVDDPVVKVYDARTGQLLRKLEGHTDRVNCVAFHPDGRRLASCGSDKTVRIWELDRGREVLTLRGHAETVTSMLFDPKGWRLASSSWDGTLRVWDGTPQGAAPGRRCVTLPGHTDKVFSVAFGPDGRQLASAGQDRTVRLWDVAGAREIRTLEGHTETVFAAVLGKGGLLVSGSFDGTVRIWDARTGALVHTQQGPETQARGLALSADGRILVTSSIAGPFEVWLWDVRHAEEGPRLEKRRPLLEEDSGPAFSVAFSPDGKHVSTARADGNLIVWDTATGRKQIALERPGSRVRPWAVAFHPNGRHLAAGYSGKDLLIWDWADPKKAPVVLRGPTEPGHTEDVHSVAYSPDGRWLASASWHEVIIWDAATHKEVRRLGGFPGLIWSVAWSPGPDRYLLAVGGGRPRFGLVELWDVTDLTQKGGADEPGR